MDVNSEETRMPVDRRQFVASMAALAIGRGFRDRLAHALEPPLASMTKRRIPRTGEEIPVVGMGTWQTFDPRPATPETLARLSKVLEVFLAAGGRVIDSSPMYGRSEEIAGNLLHKLGAIDSTFLATKIWTNGAASGRQQLDESRRLFRRPRLDLEQVHNLVDWRVQLDLLRRAKAEGQVRYVGVTHYTESSFKELETVIRKESVDFVQLPYSVAVRGAETRLLPAAAEAGVAVLVNRPFEGGGLFATARGKPLPEWAKPFATSWAQLFLKFILSNAAVTCVIPATTNPDHMRDDVAAGEGPLLGARERALLLREIGIRS